MLDLRATVKKPEQLSSKDLDDLAKSMTFFKEI